MGTSRNAWWEQEHEQSWDVLPDSDDIPVAVLGGGTMGHGIALVLASAGCAVRLMDTQQAVLTRAIKSIQREVAQLASHGMLRDKQVAAIPARIVTGTDLAWAIENARLVIEAVPEQLELKQHVFNDLDRLCHPDTILTSNSSAIPISDIVRGLRWPDRAAGWHWFSPPHLVPLVEVVRGEQTSHAVVEWLRRFTLHIGRTPIVVRRDLPGFVANRLQHALMREVLNLLDAGIASAEDLDRAVCYSFGIRLMASGPIEQRDLAGLDVHHAAASRIYPTLSNAAAPAGRLTELVQHQHLGIKTGRGFYDWSGENPGNVMQDRDERLIAAVKLLRTLDRDHRGVNADDTDTVAT